MLSCISELFMLLVSLTCANATDAHSQETEIHRHCQLHSALWGMPNWSYWSEGHSSVPDSLFNLLYKRESSIQF